MTCAKCGCTIGNWVWWISDCQGKLSTFCCECTPQMQKPLDWGPIQNMRCLLVPVTNEKENTCE